MLLAVAGMGFLFFSLIALLILDAPGTTGSAPPGPDGGGGG